MKLPAVSAQIASAKQSSVPCRHSLTLAQVAPSPAQPGLQVQTAPPAVFWQVAFASQPAAPVAHSSMSAQEVTPSPVKPTLHAQLQAPVVLVQSALGRQSSVPWAHSSTSAQLAPLPL